MVITGDKGELRVGYHCAAKLARWSLSSSQDSETLGGNPKEATLHAIVTNVNDFWSRNPQFTLGLFMGPGPGGNSTWWIWQSAVVDGDLVRGTVQATVFGSPAATSTF